MRNIIKWAIDKEKFVFDVKGTTSHVVFTEFAYICSQFLSDLPKILKKKGWSLSTCCNILCYLDEYLMSLLLILLLWLWSRTSNQWMIFILSTCRSTATRSVEDCMSLVHYSHSSSSSGLSSSLSTLSTCCLCSSLATALPGSAISSSRRISPQPSNTPGWVCKEISGCSSRLWLELDHFDDRLLLMNGWNFVNFEAWWVAFVFGIIPKGLMSQSCWGN